MIFLQRIDGWDWKPQLGGLTGIVGVSEKQKHRSRKKAVVRMRYLNLSSEVQVTPDDDKFICGHGSRRLMWVEVNIVRDEEVKEQNGHIIE